MLPWARQLNTCWLLLHLTRTFARFAFQFNILYSLFLQAIPRVIPHQELFKRKNPASRMGNSASSSLQGFLAILSLGWCSWWQHACPLPVITTNAANPRTFLCFNILELLSAPSLTKQGNSELWLQSWPLFKEPERRRQGASLLVRLGLSDTEHLEGLEGYLCVSPAPSIAITTVRQYMVTDKERELAIS